jgi:hypothetical protein
MVNEILTERSKHRLAYIDAEGLASHISITSESNSGIAKKEMNRVSLELQAQNQAKE